MSDEGSRARFRTRRRRRGRRLDAAHRLIVVAVEGAGIGIGRHRGGSVAGIGRHRGGSVAGIGRHVHVGVDPLGQHARRHIEFLVRLRERGALVLRVPTQHALLLPLGEVRLRFLARRGELGAQEGLGATPLEEGLL